MGNIYADEALWRSKLHPLRTARTLRPADERRLYRDVVAVLAEAVERRGSSIDDYTAPDGDGEMQEHLDVYQRTGQPCHRCGRPIRRIVVGIRATHFCSWCQRLPAARSRGRRAAPAHDDARARAAPPARGPAADGSSSTARARSGRTDREAERARAADAARTAAAAATRREAARRGAGATA